VSYHLLQVSLDQFGHFLLVRLDLNIPSILFCSIFTSLCIVLHITIISSFIIKVVIRNFYNVMYIIS